MPCGRIARDPAYFMNCSAPLYVKTNTNARTAFGLIAQTLAAAVVLLASSLTLARADELPPGVTYASDADPVRITAVSFDPAHPGAGDLVSAQIVCTSNAAAVTAKVGTLVVNVPKRAPGIFRTTLRVPSLPLYSTHQTVIITAIRTDGATDRRAITVDLR
jgi:hypothetical protein